MLILNTRMGIIDNPETITQYQKKQSHLPDLNPSFDIKKANVQDILCTIESPSHWRYFENKRKLNENKYSLNFDMFPNKQGILQPYRSMQKLVTLDHDGVERMLLKQEVEERN